MAGRINGSWDLYVTQRWVAQPQAELNFYSKDDRGRQTGSGFSDIDPYIGWAYNGKYGDSAVYTRQSGEATRNSSFVFGVRLVY